MQTRINIRFHSRPLFQSEKPELMLKFDFCFIVALTVRMYDVQYKQYAQTSTSLNLNHLSFILRPSIAPKFKTFLFFHDLYISEFYILISFFQRKSIFYYLHRFERLLGPCVDILKRNIGLYQSFINLDRKISYWCDSCWTFTKSEFFSSSKFWIFELCLWYFAQNFRLLYFAKHEFCKTWISSSCDKKDA